MTEHFHSTIPTTDRVHGVQHQRVGNRILSKCLIFKLNTKFGAEMKSVKL